MKTLLSIIVPVYNAEKWLRRCVDSLLNQDLPREDYEIILVDDGSADGSPMICDEYQAAHAGLVRVIHQPNSGVSMARNAALDVAVGGYVVFVDADDYIEPNCLKEVVEKAHCGDAGILCGFPGLPVQCAIHPHRPQPPPGECQYAAAEPLFRRSAGGVLLGDHGAARGDLFGN